MEGRQGSDDGHGDENFSSRSNGGLLMPCLVAHRGFHNSDDSDAVRPLENTQNAYELAWAAGVQHAECDVVATKDGVVVLCHDDSLQRLGMDR